MEPKNGTIVTLRPPSPAPAPSAEEKPEREEAAKGPSTAAAAKAPVDAHPQVVPAASKEPKPGSQALPLTSCKWKSGPQIIHLALLLKMASRSDKTIASGTVA